MKKVLVVIKDIVTFDFSKHFPPKLARIWFRFWELVQINVIYLHALIVLMYSVRNNLGYFPEMFYYIIPYANLILNQKIFEMLSYPEKTYFLHIIVMDLIFNRPNLNVSLIVKFNILLLTTIETFQNLTIGYFDFFCHKELGAFSSKQYMDQNLIIDFFHVYFLLYLLAYIYCYICAIQGKIPKYLPNGITESIGFWLKIRKKKKKSN